MNKHLHIVCLDVPYPADYGGAIDMMERIREFHKAGVLIHLHYFSYNERGTPNELNQFCDSIHVYDRIPPSKGFSMQVPYIVSSRINDELINRLNEDKHPIILEGIHCSGILPMLDLTGRKVVVRMHNEESLYYKELARAENSLVKKMYFLNESRLLKKYSQHLPEECMYACVTEKDRDAFRTIYQLPNVELLPTFPAWTTVRSEEGQGSFCLYHGNLSVPENEEAAIWLLCKVFTKVRVHFIIAGKKPSKRLMKVAELCDHTCLVADPSESEMTDLVRKAHINVLPCFNKNNTGIRLKLLHALFEGRHCLVNEPIVEGTHLEEACHISDSAAGFASVISQLYYQPFAEEEIRLRRSLLRQYDNTANTKKMMHWLW
ncbi:MAG: glycosyltransferase [Chitinophagaceae bacterium]|nr:MAG: glycosyltransferase [Chitinophagaceae bacterium]